MHSNDWQSIVEAYIFLCNISKKAIHARWNVDGSAAHLHRRRRRGQFFGGRAQVAAGAVGGQPDAGQSGGADRPGAVRPRRPLSGADRRRPRAAGRRAHGCRQHGRVQGQGAHPGRGAGAGTGGGGRRHVPDRRADRGGARLPVGVSRHAAAPVCRGAGRGAAAGAGRALPHRRARFAAGGARYLPRRIPAVGAGRHRRRARASAGGAAGNHFARGRRRPRATGADGPLQPDRGAPLRRRRGADLAPGRPGRQARLPARRLGLGQHALADGRGGPGARRAGAHRARARPLGRHGFFDARHPPQGRAAACSCRCRLSIGSAQSAGRGPGRAISVRFPSGRRRARRWPCWRSR